jgi:hypothetical protein
MRTASICKRPGCTHRFAYAGGQACLNSFAWQRSGMWLMRSSSRTQPHTTASIIAQRQIAKEAISDTDPQECLARPVSNTCLHVGGLPNDSNKCSAAAAADSALGCLRRSVCARILCAAVSPLLASTVASRRLCCAANRDGFDTPSLAAALSSATCAESHHLSTRSNTRATPHWAEFWCTS